MKKMSLKTHIVTPLLLASLVALCSPTRAAEVQNIDVPIADGPCEPLCPIDPREHQFRTTLP